MRQCHLAWVNKLSALAYAEEMRRYSYGTDSPHKPFPPHYFAVLHIAKDLIPGMGTK